MNSKIKKISALISASMLVFSGCFPMKSNNRTYDSDFSSAKEYAEYWCGPCEEIDSHSFTLDGDEITIHTLTDSEYGFTYTVREEIKQNSGKRKQNVSYACEDFDYYYVKEFLNQTDLSSVTDKYDINIEINELKPGATEGYYFTYVPTIKLSTKVAITDEEGNEIMQFIYDSIQSFDSRKRFTKDSRSTSVFFDLYSAPTDEDKNAGKENHSLHGKYGYK